MAPSASSPQDSDSGASRLLIWAAVIMLVLSFPLIFNLVGRLDAQSRAQAGVDQVSTQVSRSVAKRDQLQARLDYVTGETYVEWRARVEYRLTKKGEIAVVPSATQTLPQRIWLDDAPETGK